MGRSIRKEAVFCPSCGHSQLESRHCLATICNACGGSFKPGAHRANGRPPSGFFSNAKPLFHKPPRPVHCYRCGTEHAVSAYAETTLCPGCGGQIRLADFVISEPSSRNVDIRGKLVVEKNGSLSALYAICRSARIEGRISGVLLCEDGVVLGRVGRSRVRIDAESVLIERRGMLSTPFAVTTGEIVIAGELTADIFCWGTVVIKRTGRLRGDVRAKSFRADKGSVFQGALSIHRDQRPKRELALAKADFPALQAHLPRVLPQRVAVI